jgi:hypothetical protein
MEVAKECLPPSTPGVSAKPRRSSRTLIALVAQTRTTLVTKAASGRGSSWDESNSESEVEVVGTIYTSDAPRLNVEGRFCVFDCNGRGSREL